MTTQSKRILLSLRIALLASLFVLHPQSAFAASYKKCFAAWASGINKNKNVAFQMALTAWNSKAKSKLGGNHATWGHASNRQKKIKKIFAAGQPKMKVSLYGKYCKNTLPLSTNATKRSDNIIRRNLRVSNP